MRAVLRFLKNGFNGLRNSHQQTAGGCHPEVLNWSEKNDESGRFWSPLRSPSHCQTHLGDLSKAVWNDDQESEFSFISVLAVPVNKLLGNSNPFDHDLGEPSWFANVFIPIYRITRTLTSLPYLCTLYTTKEGARAKLFAFLIVCETRW